MSRPKVTVITCTARSGGIDILLQSLKRQTFQDFRCLLIDELYSHRHEELINYWNANWADSYGDKLLHIKPLKKKENRFWNLSQSLNHGLALAGGDLILFVQDYLWIPSNGFEKFVQLHEQIGDCLISGVGHKGSVPDWAVQLHGKISIFSDTYFPECSQPQWAWEKPEGIWHKDPRITGSGLHPAQPIEWEGNYASVTKRICEELGGFDEDFDYGWGYDNTNFAERAQALGYEIWLDESNEHVGFSHELLFKERDLKDKAPNNMNMWEQKCEDIQQRKIGIKLNYLNEVRDALRLGVLQ